MLYATFKTQVIRPFFAPKKRRLSSEMTETGFQIM